MQMEIAHGQNLMASPLSSVYRLPYGRSTAGMTYTIKSAMSKKYNIYFVVEKKNIQLMQHASQPIYAPWHKNTPQNDKVSCTALYCSTV